MFLESPINLPAATLKIAEDEEGTTKNLTTTKKAKKENLRDSKP